MAVCRNNMPVLYRRIRCKKEGGIRLTVSGSSIFISVLISNVAGARDIAAVKVKGSRTGWLPMGRSWGQNQPLSFEVTISNRVTVTSFNVAPKKWNYGQTFEGKQFYSGNFAVGKRFILFGLEICVRRFFFPQFWW